MIRVPDFDQEEEYRILRETAASYAVKELAPRAEQMDLDPASGTARDALARTGEMGLLAALVPEEYGGGGLDAYALCVALEEMAVEEAGVAASLLVHNAALLPSAVGKFEGLITGMGAESFPACLAFPGKVSLTGGKAEGRVPFAFNAPGCPFMTLIPAGGPGNEALTLRGNADGVGITEDPGQMGLRAARAGSIVLSGVEPANVISGGNMRDAVERLLYLGLASMATGIARKALDKAHAYACERYQAGKMIVEHQGIRLLLAEMVTAVEEGRSMVKRASQSEDLAPAMSAWLKVTRSAHQAALDGVQVHGGYGYMRDYGMERLMRDVKYCQIYPTTPQEALLRLLELAESR